MFLTILQNGQPKPTKELPAKLVAGRQEVSRMFKDPAPVEIIERLDPETGASHRLVFAPNNATSISRRQLALEQKDPTTILVSNLGKIENKLTIRVLDAEGKPARHWDIGPQMERELPLPVTLEFEEFVFRILAANDDEADDQFDDDFVVVPKTLTPSSFRASDNTMLPFSAVLNSEGTQFGEQEYEQLLERLDVVVKSMQVAATSGDFLAQMVQATRKIAGLDRVAVLLRNPNDDSFAVRNAVPAGFSEWRPSQAIVNKVAKFNRCFHSKPVAESALASLATVLSLVAAPIHDKDQQVAGVLYGDRQRIEAPISRVDARLMEILASGISAGLLRVEQETLAIESQVRLQQFVTPAIARQVQADPSLLEGRNKEVSLLFCDISGFSGIADPVRQDPAVTVAWLNDVLEVLSQCVLKHDGTLVDYGGDEMFALFGAPLSQHDHGQRACQAGFEILQSLAEINAKWQTTLGRETKVGVGINTGEALVGNIGSRVKLKYGAHGQAVNVASRVQTATRYFGVPFLATQATVQLLATPCSCRRLGPVRLKNIAEPVVLYEVYGAVSEDGLRLRAEFETALGRWEEGDVADAVRILTPLAEESNADPPSRALLTYLNTLPRAGREAPPVWELPGK